MCQDKIQQANANANKTKINQINDNHIKFEVSLHFGGDLVYCAAYKEMPVLESPTALTVGGIL